MLTLNENQVKELEEFIQNLPTKYGLPLLNLMRKFSSETQTKQVDVNQVVENIDSN